MAPTQGDRPAWKWNPTSKPITIISATVKQLRTTSARVRQIHGQRAKPVGHARAKIIGDAGHRGGTAKQRRLHDDPREEIVDVAVVATHSDAAAEQGA